LPECASETASAATIQQNLAIAARGNRRSFGFASGSVVTVMAFFRCTETNGVTTRP
jgi:hypothetical protein